MDRLLFAIVAFTGAAFAALAPAGADSVGDLFKHADDGARESRLAEATAPACRIEMQWKYDYAGQPYLKKVRICA